MIETQKFNVEVQYTLKNKRVDDTLVIESTDVPSAIYAAPGAVRKKKRTAKDIHVLRVLAVVENKTKK